MKPKSLNREEMKNVAGGEIRKYRNQLCYSQEYMASKLGIGQSAYQKIESGGVKISIERLVQIAKILGQPMEAFIPEGEHTTSIDSKTLTIVVNQREWDLTQKVILQQENRIAELEDKLRTKNKELEDLKLMINDRNKKF